MDEQHDVGVSTGSAIPLWMKRVSMMMKDEQFMQRAIDIALKVEREGNPPVGAVITLAGEVIAEGGASLLVPKFDGTRHAEMEALRVVPQDLWRSSHEMSIYSTLEPCLMCVGAAVQALYFLCVAIEGDQCLVVFLEGSVDPRQIVDRTGGDDRPRAIYNGIIFRAYTNPHLNNIGGCSQKQLVPIQKGQLELCVLAEVDLLSFPPYERAVRAAQILVEVDGSLFQDEPMAAGHVRILESHGIVPPTPDADPFRRGPQSLTLVRPRDKLQLDHPNLPA